MAKDKLLTIPIESDKRDRLNKYCQDKRIKVSELITEYIDNVLSGSIDIDRSIGSSISIESIEPSIDHEIEEKYTTLTALYNHIGEYTVDNLKSIFDRLDAIELTLAKQKHIEPSIDIEPIELSIEPSIDIEPIELSIDIEPSIEPSIDIEPIEPSIEDTKTLISQKMESRRSTIGGRKVTLDEIAIQLMTYNYPHPNGKKWTRLEVTKIAKEWGIRTS